MAKSRILRPPGLIVFALFVTVVAGVWWLWADTLLRRGIEATGASLVGAKVDLESADLRLGDGSIRLTRLQVANPDAPMTNLVEAGEVALDVMVEPLLSKKVVVQRMVVTGVRFNTPRETSGALENPDPEAGQLWRNVNGWADQVRGSLPTFSLETLTGSVRTEAISVDSLRTVQYAREVVARVDSMRASWESTLVALDPRPRIDSLTAVVQRLEAFRPSPLNVLQIPELVTDGRAALAGVTALESDVVALHDDVQAGISTVAMGPDVIADLRAQDLAYARSLLNIPSLEAPSISPALFGGTALTWLKPVLYWASAAERFLPPGLDPRRRPGPSRARAEGTTVAFPRRATWPAFTLQQGEIGLEIGGSGLAAGAYTALLSGLTSAPSLLGEPLELTLAREGGAQGPRGVSLSALLDHTTDVVRDSAALSLAGVSLPEIDIGPLGGSLDLGLGESAFSFSRVGDQLEAHMRWTSTDLGWTRTDAPAAGSPPPQIGSAPWARELVWRTLTGVEMVELDMGLQGTLESPSLTVASNLGDELAASLRRELGQQIEDAEARLRQEVDARIQPVIEDARTRLDAVRTEVVDRVEAERREVEELQARLESRIRELTSR